MQPLDHERLEVYQLALQFVSQCEVVVLELPRGRAYIADQLRRASLSVVNNIAEGAGEYARLEKRRFYRIARRSTTECAAMLDVCRELELVRPETHQTCRTLVVRLVSMLVALTRKSGEHG